MGGRGGGGGGAGVARALAAGAPLSLPPVSEPPPATRSATKPATLSGIARGQAVTPCPAVLQLRTQERVLCISLSPCVLDLSTSDGRRRPVTTGRRLLPNVAPLAHPRHLVRGAGCG